MRKSKRGSLGISYLIIVFCVLWSGGAATYALFNNWPILGLFLGLFLLYYNKIRVSFYKWCLLGLFNALLCLQMVVYGGSITTALHQMLIVSDVFLFSFIVAKSFAHCFVKIIIVFAIISIPFYILNNIGFHGILMAISDSIPQLGVENMWENGKQTDLHTLYLYNIYTSEFSVQSLSRNPGPFWEPGRFTIYINIALLINLFYFKKDILSLSNLTLILTNITVMSTTGISAMLIIFFTYLFVGKISKGNKIFFGTLLLAILPVILSLDFMSDKVQDEMGSDATYSRFGAIAYHWTQISQSPFLGFGPFLGHVFGEDLASSPNGVTDSIRYFGIPFAIFIWFLLYSGTHLYIKGKLERVSAFIILMILAFTQTIMTSPFYLLLYMFSVQTVKDKRRNRKLKKLLKLKNVRLSPI